MVDEGSLKVMNGRGLTEQSFVYRVMSPLFFVGKRFFHFLVEGNPESQTNIFDHEGRRMRSSDLHDPGLNVTFHRSEEYQRHGSFEIKFRLKSVFSRGGKLYEDCGSGATSALYVTIPKGKKIPVTIIKGTNEAANLILEYHRIRGEYEAAISDYTVFIKERVDVSAIDKRGHELGYTLECEVHGKDIHVKKQVGSNEKYKKICLLRLLAHVPEAHKIHFEHETLKVKDVLALKFDP